MLKPKSKIQLSEALKIGVAGPASQSTLYKAGGVFFLLLSLLLAKNIYTQLKGAQSSATAQTSANLDQQVLGAYSGTSNSVSAQLTYYTVQKGDTLFTIAMEKNVSWDVIATLNNLKAPYTLHIGQIRKVPQVQ